MTYYSTYTPQQSHDDITALFDAYYDAKKAGDSIPPNKRIESADAIVEQYVGVNGQRPPASVLSRLATYILLDTLSDSHPDKMAREEYPIMSYGQVGRRYEQSITKGDVQYRDMRHLGRRKVNASMTSDDGEVDEYNSQVHSIHLVAQDFTQEDEIISGISFGELLLNAGLTEREREVLSETFIHNRTQSEIAEELTINQSRISRLYNGGLDKIREYLTI